MDERRTISLRALPPEPEPGLEDEARKFRRSPVLPFLAFMLVVLAGLASLFAMSGPDVEATIRDLVYNASRR